MKRRLLFSAAAAVVVLAGGAAAIPALRGIGAGLPVPVYEVTRGDFSRTVVAEGILEAEETTPLIAPMEVRRSLTIAWLAPDGSYVKEGDVVVRFDPTEMERDLADGRSERETVDNRIKKKEVEDANVIGNLTRDAKIADRELDYARTFQSKDPEIFSRSEIIESEIDEGLATRRKGHAEGARSIQEDLSRVEVDLLEIEKTRANIKIEQAEDALRSTAVVAPHDGIFVLARNWRGTVQVGETVWPGRPVGEIPRLEVMRAKVYVLEADAGGIEEGCPADVILEAHPGEVHSGEVVQVAALATQRSWRSPVQYFEVLLSLDLQDRERMKPGQLVKATLRPESHEGVLAIPREAVIEEEDGEKIVYRKTLGGFEPVKVVLGSTALGRVVVEEGLEEGDVIALADPTRRNGEGEANGGGETVPRAAGGMP